MSSKKQNYFLQEKTVKEMKAICRQQGLKGYSSLIKQELETLLIYHFSKKGDISSTKLKKNIPRLQLKAFCHEKNIHHNPKMNKSQLNKTIDEYMEVYTRFPDSKYASKLHFTLVSRRYKAIKFLGKKQPNGLWLSKSKMSSLEYLPHELFVTIICIKWVMDKDFLMERSLLDYIIPCDVK